MRRVVIVNDKMQQGYRYELSASVGRDFDPQFRPDLTRSKCSSPLEAKLVGVEAGKTRDRVLELLAFRRQWRWRD